MYGVLALVVNVAPAVSQVGTVDYVPNGGFENISVDEAQLGMYTFRCGMYSLWWRQFHKWTLPNELGTLPKWPIWQDRRWNEDDPMYQPVTCSSSDLFSAHLPDCENWVAASLWDIPRNWFGYEPIRPGSFGQKYAGLYYRVNGIRLNQLGHPEPFDGSPATDFWREYLEVELLCELQANTTYNLSFWVSLAEVSERSIRLEARVSQQPYHTHPQDNCNEIEDNDELQSRVRIPVTDGPAGISIFSPQLLPKFGNAPNNGWTLVQGIITAAGGEKYLTIGNFDLNNGLEPIAIENECLNYYGNKPNSRYRVYFYVDDVRLKRIEECVCDAGVRIYRIAPSPIAGKCCYSYTLTNGDSEFACRSCTIEGVDAYVVSAQNVETLVHSWNASQSHGPIVGDKIPVELGQICLDNFSGFKELSFKVKRTDGTLLCTRYVNVFGCVDPCDCSAFYSSIELTPITSGSNPCCYRLKINANLLPTACQIDSIKYFRHTSEGWILMPEANYNSPVSSTFSGYIHTFCPASSIDDQDIRVEFRNSAGVLICEYIFRPKCNCSCKESRVEVRMEQVTASNGKCCFDIRVINNKRCKVKLKKIIIARVEESIVTASSGWTSSVVNSNKELTSGSGVSLLPSTSLVIGRICPGDCPITDPSWLQIWADFESPDESCTRVQVQNATEAACPFVIDCSKFTVSLVAYPVENSASCCWFGIYASVDACPSAMGGLRIDVVKGDFHQNVPTPGPFRTLITALSCNYGVGTYTVRLTRADGTVLCTRTITTQGCFTTGNLPVGSKKENTINHQVMSQP